MESRNIVLAVRVIQSVLFGVFLLGISMSAGDLMPIYNFPISPLSMTTMLYGALGTIVCEFFARRLEKWSKDREKVQT